VQTTPDRGVEIGRLTVIFLAAILFSLGSPNLVEVGVALFRDYFAQILTDKDQEAGLLELCNPRPILIAPVNAT